MSATRFKNVNCVTVIEASEICHYVMLKPSLCQLSFGEMSWSFVK